MVYLLWAEMRFRAYSRATRSLADRLVISFKFIAPFQQCLVKWNFHFLVCILIIRVNKLHDHSHILIIIVISDVRCDVFMCQHQCVQYVNRDETVVAHLHTFWTGCRDLSERTTIKSSFPNKTLCSASVWHILVIIFRIKMKIIVLMVLQLKCWTHWL